MQQKIELKVTMWVEADSFESALYLACGKINRIKRTPVIPKIHCEHELVSGVLFLGAKPL